MSPSEVVVNVSSKWSIPESHLVSFSWNEIDVWVKVKAEPEGKEIDISEGTTPIFQTETGSSTEIDSDGRRHHHHHHHEEGNFEPPSSFLSPQRGSRKPTRVLERVDSQHYSRKATTLQGIDSQRPSQKSTVKEDTDQLSSTVNQTVIDGVDSPGSSPKKTIDMITDSSNALTEKLTVQDMIQKHSTRKTKSYEPSAHRHTHHYHQHNLEAENNVRTFFGLTEVCRKRIIRSVSGFVKQGELCALMGSSGAGKTTLLNILTMRTSSKLEISGDVCINGIKIGAKEISTMSAYVQQGDVFPGALTVMEHLMFYANMKMDSKCTHKERVHRVKEVIEEFSLTKCKNLQIGITGRIKGISGGEKRRLAVASECLWNPDLIFCDEPLSGLDSFTAEELMGVIKMLTSKLNKTIICTVHQPSYKVFDLFDRVILLSEGRNAFTGSIQDAKIHFSQLGYVCPRNENPSDYYIEILTITPSWEKINDGSKKRVEQLCDDFITSSYYSDILKFLENPVIDEEDEIRLEEARNMPTYKTNFLYQLIFLFMRSIRCIIQDRMALLNKFLMAIGLGLFVGCSYYDLRIPDNEFDFLKLPNVAAVVFMLMVHVSIQNVFAVLNTFHEDSPLFYREHHNQMYYAWTYFISSQLAEIPALVIFPAIFYSFTYTLTRLTWKLDDYLVTGFYLILVSQCAATFSYFVAVISKSVNVALSVAPGFLIPLFMFAGFFIRGPDMPTLVRLISYVSWYYWGNKAMLPIQMQNVKFVKVGGCLAEDYTELTCRSGPDLMDQLYDFGPDFKEVVAPILIAVAFAFRILTFLGILWKTRK